MADVIQLDPARWPTVTLGGVTYTARITWDTLRRAKEAGIDLDNPAGDADGQVERIENMAKVIAVVFSTRKNPVSWEALCEEIDEDTLPLIMECLNAAKKKPSSPDVKPQDPTV